MLWQFFSWYLVLQLLTLAALPLTLTLFPNLPDRGYAFSKSVGVLAVGFVFWLGYSYGLFRNEAGGAWLSLLLVAVASGVIGRTSGLLAQMRVEKKLPVNWRYMVGVELIFLAFFALWATVRAYDPRVDHTEEPMDLMFMNSIWASATYPPQDAWLGGYAISYYYFGYWLLTTVGRLAGQPPEIAYTLGQASWYGLLWIGCFGMGYNLLAQRDGKGGVRATLSGLLTGLTVAAVGNFQSIWEWLHANGYNVTGMAQWFGVRGFPEGVPQTGLWYISMDWWWWRPSRVISDRWLNGDHMEVIDEFPIFSYVLGDNHPHVLAMPFVILLIALLFNLFLNRRQPAIPVNRETGASAWLATLQQTPAFLLDLVRSVVPAGLVGAVSLVVAGGALVFLNTWDFPPYWLLLMSVTGLLVWRALGQLTTLSNLARSGQAVAVGVISGVLLVIGLLLFYWPYFLTAQSQAGGIVPNLFNPSRLPQFFLMFGFALLGVCALLGLAWQTLAPAERVVKTSHWVQLGGLAALVYGLPILFLILSTLFATTVRGQSLLAGNMPLPPGATSYLPYILDRWSSQSQTFLVLGALLTLVLWLGLRYVGVWDRTAPEETESNGRTTTIFVLLLAAIGLLLVYAPEFVYLRDNFGTRMNTVFKFYYQAWLLFGLAVSYTIVVALSSWSARAPVALGTNVCAALSLVIVLSGIVFPLAATYSKTGGFAGTPTFDSTAYLAQAGPAELAAATWVRANTAPDAMVVESKGASYWSNYNRISTITGRPTLLGWDGHESQWRGKAYGEMAQGRVEALRQIYCSRTPEPIVQVLATWEIDYVYVGPMERSQLQIGCEPDFMTPENERALAAATDLAFEEGDVRIYQRRR